MQAEFVKICNKVFKVATGLPQARLAAKAALTLEKKLNKITVKIDSKFLQ